MFLPSLHVSYMKFQHSFARRRLRKRRLLQREGPLLALHSTNGLPDGPFCPSGLVFGANLTHSFFVLHHCPHNCRSGSRHFARRWTPVVGTATVATSSPRRQALPTRRCHGCSLTRARMITVAEQLSPATAPVSLRTARDWGRFSSPT